jgi:tetratricopeptide (TPR) repeat protein
MLATAKFPVFPGKEHPNPGMKNTACALGFRPFVADSRAATCLLRRMAIVFALFALSGIASAELSETNRARFAAHAQKTLVEAQKRHDQSPTNSAAAWNLASAFFDRAEFSTNDTERATLAEQGIEVSRKALKRDPKSGPLHYYLGLNLGQLARTKSFGALRLLPEMESEFKAAIAADENFSQAAPHRTLGVLYSQAPSWTVGSRSKAAKHLERAVGLAPDFPENRLALAEAYLEWRDKDGLRRELESIQRIWVPAKTNFTGADWESQWLDWTGRRRQLEQDARNMLKP